MATKRVLLVCSPGGHLLQLLALETAWRDIDPIWVTYSAPDIEHLLHGQTVILAYGPTNRNITNLLRNIVVAWTVLRKYDPHVVLSSGAGVALPFFYLGWLQRRRLVYVESLARVHNTSLTGRLVYPLCDAFFVQWPTTSRLARARYVGNVL